MSSFWKFGNGHPREHIQVGLKYINGFGVEGRGKYERSQNEECVDSSDKASNVPFTAIWEVFWWSRDLLLWWWSLWGNESPTQNSAGRLQMGRGCSTFARNFSTCLPKITFFVVARDRLTNGRGKRAAALDMPPLNISFKRPGHKKWKSRKVLTIMWNVQS